MLSCSSNFFLQIRVLLHRVGYRVVRFEFGIVFERNFKVCVRRVDRLLVKVTRLVVYMRAAAAERRDLSKGGFVEVDGFRYQSGCVLQYLNSLFEIVVDFRRCRLNLLFKLSEIVSCFHLLDKIYDTPNLTHHGKYLTYDTDDSKLNHEEHDTQN